MRRRAVPAFVFPLFAAVLPLATSLAQAPATPTSQLPTLTTRSTLVVVPALVRDGSGALIYNLAASDFTLTDDGVPQMLHLEEDTGGEPLALAVVIEAGAATRASGWHPNKPRGENPDRLRGLPAMVEAVVGAVKHQVAVVGFDSSPELELNFTDDPVEMTDTISQLDHGNTGDHGAAILDSLIFAVDELRHAPANYRRAILLVSETNDRGSKHTLEDTLRAISDSNTAIYSVAFSSGKTAASEYGSAQLPTKHMATPPPNETKRLMSANTSSFGNPDEIVARMVEGTFMAVFLGNPTPGPPGGCMGKDPARDPTLPAESFGSRLYNCLGQLVPPAALGRMAAIAATDAMRSNVPETIAHLTGGEYLPFTDTKSLEQDLTTIANHVPNRYLLTFQPQSPHPGLHVLHLEMKSRPGVNVTARTSYWAESAAGTLEP